MHYLREIITKKAKVNKLQHQPRGTCNNMNAKERKTNKIPKKMKFSGHYFMI